MDEIYKSTHSARIDLTTYNFDVFKDGKHVSGFQIVYIWSSSGIANHLIKVKQFSKIVYVTFDKIKNQLFKIYYNIFIIIYNI